MSEERQNEPVSPVEPEVSEVPEVPEVDSAPEPERQPAPVVAPQAEVPPVDWRDRRIAQLTARLRESEAQRLAPVPAPETSGGAPALDSGEFQRAVSTEAQRLASAEVFNRQCQEVVDRGKGEFQDFSSRIEELKRIVDGGSQEAVASYSQLISAAIETGEAPRILHFLGGNLNEASRLMSLSPVRLGMEMAKMAAAEPEQISQVPKPPRELGDSAPRSTIDPDDPNRSDRLSTAEWMRRRNQQINQKAG